LQTPSGIKNPIFPKNRIFGAPMPLRGVKNPIFPKNRIFGVLMPLRGVKNPIFPKNRIFGALAPVLYALKRYGRGCKPRPA
jgi:hypothetical protein